MKTISRAEAIALGLKFYYTGKPCNRGHAVERYVSSHTCRGCAKITTAIYRNLHPKPKKERKKAAPKPVKKPKKRYMYASEARALGLTTYLGSPCIHHPENVDGCIRYACGPCVAGRKEINRASTEEDKQRTRERVNAYRISNPEQVKKSKKKTYEKNKEKILSKCKTYRETHREQRNEYERNRKATDLVYVTTVRLRNRLGAAVKGMQKGGPAVRDLGCSIPEFIVHIESLWEDEMSWKNYGLGRGKWNYDHIIPLTAFDLTNPDDMKKACHYTNIQPMWSLLNTAKRNKIING